MRARCGTVAAMALAIDQLPDDVATLKRLLVERDAEVARRLTELEAQRAEMLTARLLIEKLKLQIARLRRIQFGRRSEQHDARVEQLELIVEELETGLAASPGGHFKLLHLWPGQIPPPGAVGRVEL